MALNSLVPDSDNSVYPGGDPTMVQKGILGRTRVALSAGDGVNLTQTGGRLDVEVASSDGVATGSITAVNTGVQLNVNGLSTIGLDISGTFDASIQFQGTVDGTTWFGMTGLLHPTNGSTPAESTTNPSQWMIPANGIKTFRAFCDSFTSGQIDITIRASTGSGLDLGLTDQQLRANPVPVSGTIGGTVAVSDVTPGTGATKLGKAEDAAHTTGDVGVMALAVRNDSAVARSGTDGDYEPIPVQVLDSKAGIPVHVLKTVSACSTVGVTVSTTAVVIKASNAARKSIVITNNNVTYDLFIGCTSSVTASGANMGLKVLPGSTYQDSGDGLWKGDLYGIRGTAVASQSVSVQERT